jgi:hypothetical protein
MSSIEVAAVSSGQKGVSLLFFGSKFKLNCLRKFDKIVLHHLKELLYRHPKTNLSPNG